MQWVMDKMGYGSAAGNPDPQKSSAPSVTSPSVPSGTDGTAAERAEHSSEATPTGHYFQDEAVTEDYSRHGAHLAGEHDADVPSSQANAAPAAPPPPPTDPSLPPSPQKASAPSVTSPSVPSDADGTAAHLAEHSSRATPTGHDFQDEAVPEDYSRHGAHLAGEHEADVASSHADAAPPPADPSLPPSESPRWQGEADEEVLTGEQTLMKVSGCVLHLVDERESLLLAQGDFVLSRVMQEGREGVIIARVGEGLKWPLVQKESTVKLDRTHYFFAVQVPNPTQENSSNIDTLNYGLTLPHSSTAEEDAVIQQLDHYLDRYSTFTTPTIVTGDAQEGISKSEVLRSEDAATSVVPEEVVSGDGVVAADEEESAAFWTTIAPNVNDYNGKVAKFIASGTGNVVQDIFWLSDAAKAQLDAGHDYMKAKFQPNRESAQVSPATIGAMRNVKKVTETTDKVASGILSGILHVTGTIATKVVESKGGRMVFNTQAGQAALASMEAFGSLFDAIERAGRNVMAHSSSVTQDFVNHRYGEKARQLTDESLQSVGHATNVVWSVVKLHKAFTPSSFAKSSARSAVQTHKKGNASGARVEEDSVASSDLDASVIPEQPPNTIPEAEPSITRLKKVE